MLLALAALFTATVVATEPTPAAAGSQGAVAGTVTLTDARGETFGAPGVRLTLTCAATAGAARIATSDDSGAFRFSDVRPDHCSIEADLQGFANTTAVAVVPVGETVDVAIHLDIAPVSAGIEVVGESARSWRTKRSN